MKDKKMKNKKIDEIPWAIRNEHEDRVKSADDRAAEKHDMPVKIGISLSMIRKIKEFFKRRKDKAN